MDFQFFLQITQLIIKFHILFKCPDELLDKVYLSLFILPNNDIIVSHATSAISQIICMGLSPYTVKIMWNETERNLNIQFVCHQCNDSKPVDENDAIAVYGPLNTPSKHPDGYKIMIGKSTHHLFEGYRNCEARKNLAKALLSYVRHLDFFVDDVKLWMAFMCDDSEEVRKVFTTVISDVVMAILVVVFIYFFCLKLKQ